jgi:hypothetical protein
MFVKPLFVDKVLDYFTTLNQQNAHNFSLDIYITISHWISLRVLARHRPSSGNHTKEHIIKPNQSFLYTADVVYKSRLVKIIDVSCRVV